MINEEAGTTTFSKRFLKVSTVLGAVVCLVLAVTTVLVLALTLPNPNCSQECRNTTIVVGIVLLVFDVLSLLLLIFAQAELCKRKAELARREVVVDGVLRIGVPVRDLELERIVRTSDDVRHITKQGRSRAVQAHVERKKKLEAVQDKLQSIAAASEPVVLNAKLIVNDVVEEDVPQPVHKHEGHCTVAFGEECIFDNMFFLVQNPSSRTARLPCMSLQTYGIMHGHIAPMSGIISRYANGEDFTAIEDL